MTIHLILVCVLAMLLGTKIVWNFVLPYYALCQMRKTRARREEGGEDDKVSSSGISIMPGVEIVLAGLLTAVVWSDAGVTGRRPPTALRLGLVAYMLIFMSYLHMWIVVMISNRLCRTIPKAP